MYIDNLKHLYLEQLHDLKGPSYKNEAEKSEVSVVTRDAYKAMSKLHDQMLVILNLQNAAMAWLSEDEKLSLNDLIEPAANNALRFTEVGSYVNKSSNEGPECVEPIAA